MQNSINVTLADMLKSKRHDMVADLLTLFRWKINGWEVHPGVTNWWPVSDEEWERQNFPERFK